MAKQDTADTAAEVHDLMTVKQAAEYLQVNPKTLYRWLKNGDMPGVKLNGNVWRVPRAELERWVSPMRGLRVIKPARPVTADWLARMDRQRAELLKKMGGVPFKRGEIAEMIDEGRR